MEFLNKFLGDWQYLWFFAILFVELLVSTCTLVVVWMEYKYDANKDLEKKQRRTKTTKRTTKGKDGGEVTEETTEVSEPMGSNNVEGQASGDKREGSH